MSILKTEIGTAIPNFLDSEVGLVTKTAQIPQSMGQADGDRKTVFAGTVFPANTSAATGIVFQDVDVTDGDAIGAVMVAGNGQHRDVPMSKLGQKPVQQQNCGGRGQGGIVNIPGQRHRLHIVGSAQVKDLL